MSDRAWEEMLDEFRALGGTADNIRLAEGVHGRGIFPVDPSKPVAIRIPDNLLLDTKDAIFVGGEFRVGPNAAIGLREALFLQNYENRFSWGGGGRAEIARTMEQAQDLPSELRRTLTDEHNCGDWFKDASDGLVERKFLESRCVHYKGRVVVMPIVELLNHDPAGPHYETQHGVAVHGTFSGEVLARYSDMDPHGIFANWGFACEQPQAFSHALKSNRSEGAVEIGRDLSGLSPKTQFWIPDVSKSDAGIKLQFLMMGNQKYPRMAKGIFHKLMREAGSKNVEETFDLIQHANLRDVARLLAAVEKAHGPMAETLRRVARFQLQALSWCFGVREL